MSGPDLDLIRSGKRIFVAMMLAAALPGLRDVTLQLGYRASKYTPHQGKQECARQVRQAARANAKRMKRAETP